MLRKIFRRIGSLFTVGFISAFTFPILGVILYLIDGVSLPLYIAVTIAVSLPLISLTMKFVNDYYPGRYAKISYSFWPRSPTQGFVHQENWIVIMLGLANTPYLRRFVGSKNKFTVTRPLLRDVIDITVIALREKHFASITVASHLLNHAGAYEKVKEGILAQLPNIKCDESVEKHCDFSRAMIAWITNEKFDSVPTQVNALTFHW